MNIRDWLRKQGCTNSYVYPDLEAGVWRCRGCGREEPMSDGVQRLLVGARDRYLGTPPGDADRTVPKHAKRMAPLADWLRDSVDPLLEGK